MELTLFSSDSSGQYKKDIYNVIAAPYNSNYRFRYRIRYIDDSLITKLQKNELVNTRAVIAFRTNSDKNGVDPFIVPIRWATIKKSYLNNEICIIDFVIQEYPEFNQNFKEAAVSIDKNKEYSKAFFEKKSSDVIYVLNFAIDAASKLDYDYKRQEAAWISIIEALKHYEPFKDTSFFRTLLPTKKKNKFATSLTIRDRQYREIEIWHYCSEDSTAKNSQVLIQCDPNYINSVSGDSDRIECRYDKISYIFQAVNGKNKVKSNVTLRIYTLDTEQKIVYDSETKIIIPIKLKKRWIKRIIRSLLSFIGSAFTLAFSYIVSKNIPDISTKFLTVVAVISLIAPAINWFISSED